MKKRSIWLSLCALISAFTMTVGCGGQNATPNTSSSESSSASESTSESTSESSSESTSDSSSDSTSDSASDSTSDSASDSASDSSSDQPDYNENSKITITAPEGEVYSYNDQVRKYIEAGAGADVKDYYIKLQDSAYGVGVKWTYDGEQPANFLVEYSLNADMSDALSEKVAGALVCDSAGIVCPYDLTIAAMGNAMDNGADLYCNFRVTSIEENGGVYTVKSGDRSIEATYVINSAGVGADEIAAMVGDKYTITPKKGEYLLLDRSEGGLVSYTIFQVPGAFGKGILVTPTADGNLLVGPTSEFTEKGDVATTLEGLEKVRAIAARSTEKVNYRKVITSFAGLRSSSADSEDFIVEFSGNAPRFVELVGIESPGLSSAPAIAVYVAEMLRADGLAMEENEEFNPNRTSCRRFGTLSMEEKNEMIKADPAFGHLICRCETVTEGEILAAIRQNPPARSLDAVKRRTRAGMGRCQGGFCTTFITELLAKEQGIDETEVTKFGGDSYMLFGKTK